LNVRLRRGDGLEYDVHASAQELRERVRSALVRNVNDIRASHRIEHFARQVIERSERAGKMHFSRIPFRLRD
jgi:hypothetical protein